MFAFASRPMRNPIVGVRVAAAALAIFLPDGSRLAWATSTPAEQASVTGVLGGASPPTEVSAATSAPAHEPVVADLGIYSDYIARGLSYSRERYAVQGHLEYDSKPGLYAGAWLIHNSEIVTNADARLWVDDHGLELSRAKWLAYLRWGIP